MAQKHGGGLVGDTDVGAHPNRVAGWRGALRHWWAHVVRGLPVVVVLTFLTVLIHEFHWGDPVDGWFMRVAVKRLLAPQATLAVAAEPAKKRIHVLEASVMYRISELESSAEGLSEEDVDRVGGVRPIDRLKLADWLLALGERLGKLASEQRPQVIAIDIDVAPLRSHGKEGAPLRSQSDEGAPMAKALNALRQHADVVAIVLARDNVKARNAFIRENCTRLHEALSPKHERGGLYFASPRVFHDRYDYPLEFPFESKKQRKLNGEVFPSLGNLMHLLLVKKDQHPGTPKSPTRTLAEPGPNTTTEPQHPGAPRSLTRMCEDLHQNRPLFDKPLFEDEVQRCARTAAGDAACDEFRAAGYEPRRIHWRLLETDLIRSTQVVSSAAMVPCTDDANCQFTRLGDEQLKATAMVVGIDGGQRHDRFEGATLGAGAISGAMLHALQTLSSRPELELKDDEWAGVVIDAGVGVVFVVLGSLGGLLIERLQKVWLRHTATVCELVIPVLLAGGLGAFVVLHVSPWLLKHDLWANPVYVLFGLLVHAYAEPPASAGNGRGCSAVPDFTFGLLGLVRRGAAKGSVPRIRDPWLLPALCWATILAGQGALIWHDYKHHEFGGLMILVALLSLLAITVRFRKV